jgi:hypothetical protein
MRERPKRRREPPDKPVDRREDPRRIGRRTEPSPGRGLGEGPHAVAPDAPLSQGGIDLPPPLPQSARIGSLESEGFVDTGIHSEDPIPAASDEGSIDLSTVFGKARFPANKEDLLLEARSAPAVEPEIIDALEKIPERVYDNIASVEVEVRRAA